MPETKTVPLRQHRVCVQISANMGLDEDSNGSRGEGEDETREPEDVDADSGRRKLYTRVRENTVTGDLVSLNPITQRSCTPSRFAFALAISTDVVRTCENGGDGDKDGECGCHAGGENG